MPKHGMSLVSAAMKNEAKWRKKSTGWNCASTRSVIQATSDSIHSFRLKFMYELWRKNKN